MNANIVSKNTEASVLPGKIQQQKFKSSQINSQNYKNVSQKKIHSCENVKVLSISKRIKDKSLSKVELGERLIVIVFDSELIEPWEATRML